MQRAAITGISRLVIAAAMLSAAPRLCAQVTIGRGLEIGITYGRATGNTSFVDPIAQVSRDFSAAQTSWGAHFGITIPDLFASNLGLTIRAAYASAGATHTHHRQPVSVLVANPGGSDTIVTQQIDLILDHRSWRLEAEALARYSPVSGLSLLAGAGFGSLQVAEWKYSQYLVSPAWARFINSDPIHYSLEDDGRTLVLTGGSVLPGENHVSLAAIAGIAYTLRMFGDVSLTPELRLRYDMIEPGVVGAWRPLSIQGALSIGLNEFTDPMLRGRAEAPRDDHSLPENPPLTDRPSRDAPPTLPPPPTVAIRLYSVDEAGRTLPSASMHAVETLRSRTIDLPTAIPFDPWSDRLPAWLVDDPSASVDSLARLHPGAAAAHLLAVVAATLKESRTERITLRGSAATGEPASLAAARAASVRRVLTERFGCRASQIQVAGSRPGAPRLSFAGVVLEGSGAAPRVWTSWIERGYATSPIKVEPTIESTAEPRSWSIEFRQGPTLIARRTSADTAGQLDLDVLSRNLTAGTVPPPLSAELAVEDSAGRVVTARHELPFELSPRRDTVRTASYVLLPAAPEESIRTASLKEIASKAPAHASITIRPLRHTAEMAGERIARRCAEHLRRLLGPEARITIAGADPAGRSDRISASGFEKALDAGVEIEVTAPVPAPIRP